MYVNMVVHHALLGAVLGALVCSTRFGSLHVWHASFSPLFVSEVWPLWAYVVASATLDNSSSVPHPLPPYLARFWGKDVVRALCSRHMSVALVCAWLKHMLCLLVGFVNEHFACCIA